MLDAVLDRLEDIEIAGASLWTLPGIATLFAVGIDMLLIRFRERSTLKDAACWAGAESGAIQIVAPYTSRQSARSGRTQGERNGNRNG